MKIFAPTSVKERWGSSASAHSAACAPSSRDMDRPRETGWRPASTGSSWRATVACGEAGGAWPPAVPRPRDQERRPRAGAPASHPRQEQRQQPRLVDFGGSAFECAPSCFVRERLAAISSSTAQDSPGWSQILQLDGRFPRADPTSPGRRQIPQGSARFPSLKEDSPEQIQIPQGDTKFPETPEDSPAQIQLLQDAAGCSRPTSTDPARSKTLQSVSRFPEAAQPSPGQIRIPQASARFPRAASNDPARSRMIQRKVGFPSPPPDSPRRRKIP